MAAATRNEVLTLGFPTVVGGRAEGPTCLLVLAPGSWAAGELGPSTLVARLSPVRLSLWGVQI